jgi:hypothetical protein
VPPPYVEIVAKLDRTKDRPDYAIFAGKQLVGRIYRVYLSSTTETWWWGLHTITFDSSMGPPETTKGYTNSLPWAQESLGAAFDHWLAWARAVPRGDMKYERISVELKTIGAV